MEKHLKDMTITYNYHDTRLFIERKNSMQCYIDYAMTPAEHTKEEYKRLLRSDLYEAIGFSDYEADEIIKIIEEVTDDYFIN